jgi:hypothetical protein
MRPRTNYVYSVLAIAFAVAFGLAVGPFWVDDAMALALMVLFVISYYLSQTQEIKALMTWWSPMTKDTHSEPARRSPLDGSDRRTYTPRSKIARFVLLSKIRFTAPSTLDSYNSFERALLRRSDWRSLSDEELKAMVESQRAHP